MYIRIKLRILQKLKNAWVGAKVTVKAKKEKIFFNNSIKLKNLEGGE
ncbi:hypothetical protein R4K54_09450 [Brachyspira murdochii]|uniref:Uncharacterized protein n=1 Tax=Brachyspira murdochii (strain ATCC 51284 / DSM 12563 / 56-150) TaxID=526224 RepID=D5U9J7_BRAM5|nr:hypothetical protein [Brachyspira murdochii]ADG71370.1 hypothetical protein Bmur_1278 [Brachyspira murdochii DSM 12563]